MSELSIVVTAAIVIFLLSLARVVHRWWKARHKPKVVDEEVPF